MKKIYILLVLLIIAGNTLAASGNPFIPKAAPSSTSFSNDPFGQMVNPALSNYQDSTYFSYFYNTCDIDENGSHFLQLGFPFVSIVYNYYDQLYSEDTGVINKTAVHYFNFAKSFQFSDSFMFGISYAFSSSDRNDYDDYRSWNFGFIWRPARYISASYIIRESWASLSNNSLDRIHGIGLAIRPLTDRITLSVDGTMDIDDTMSDLSNWDFKYGLDVRLQNDISFFAAMDKSSNISFGATIPFFAQGNPGSTIVYHARSSYLHKHGSYNSGLGLSLPVSNYKKAMLILDDKGTLLIDFNTQLPEVAVTGFLEDTPILFHDLLNAIKTAKSDNSIDSITLEINQLRLGMAQIQEIIHALNTFKQTGKKIYAIMHYAGNREYYLAATAHTIYFTPNATFQLTGLSAEVYFIKGLMNKAGIQFESIKRGTYKSFNETFTRNNMSQPFRENMTALLRNLNQQFLSHISASRNIPVKELRSIINSGPLTPQEAVNKQLVDVIAYKADVLKKLSRSHIVVKLKNYYNEPEKKHDWGDRPVIAVVNINGSILQGSTRPTSYTNVIGDEEYHKILKQAFTDPAIKVLVIRINSGGGSAIASDNMWKSLIELKKKYKKPVVFSFGNIAASGGYYIACSGDKIYATNGTITGSIGVVFGKITMQELYSKLGINKEVIKTGKFADIFSESRPLTEEEKQVLQKSVDFTYKRFVEKVAKARNIDKKNIPRVAEGRVFSGSQARANNLVDSTEGLLAAIEYAKTRAGITDRYNIINIPQYTTSPFYLFETEESRFLSKLLGPFIHNMEVIQYKNEQVLFLVPYKITIH